MLVRCDFLLDQNRGLSLEGVNSVSAVKLLFDVRVVSERFQFLEECLQILLDFLGRLGPNMCRNRLGFFPRIELKSLTYFLVISPIPVRESTLKQDLFFNSLFFGKVDKFNSLEVATVFRLEFLFDEFFKTFRVMEESIVLHNLQLLALCVFGDAYVFSLENLGTQIALI